MAIEPLQSIHAALALGGAVAPSGALVTVVLGSANIRPLTVSAQINPTGAVTTEVSGPSVEIVPKSVVGSIAPSGAVATDVGTNPGPNDTVTKSVDGAVVPVGSVATEVSGPSIETILKSIGGVISPLGFVEGVVAPTSALLTEDVDGAIAPTGSVATAVSGPSIETKTQNINGSVTPSGALATATIAPPPTFFSAAVAGAVTPSGTVATAVSGPSIETKPKIVIGVIAPLGNLTSQVTGPSFVTKPQAVSGSIAPAGTVARSVLNNPQILTKNVTGTITPIGSLNSSVNTGTPVSSSPLYTSMGGWRTNEFHLHPVWPACTFTVPSPFNLSSVTAMLQAMNTRGMKGGISLSSPNLISDDAPGGGYLFNMSKFQALVDIIASVPNIEDYIEDGTCGLICVGDELHHQKYNGTIPPNTRKQMCQYVKQKLPGVETAIRMPVDLLTGSHLPSGGWGTALDYGWAQWNGPLRTNGMTALEYYTDQKTRLAAIGLGIVGGLNWWNGGDGSSNIPGPQTDVVDDGREFWVCTTTEIRAAIDAAVQIDTMKYFMFWTDANNSNLSGSDDMLTLQTSFAYAQAWTYAKDTGLARGASTPPPPYYVDPGFTAAPHPPPTIVLGRAVRDSLTGHKVFRMVDGARTMESHHSALNADNSMIYYIKGSAGLIADVSWRVPVSEVQVSGERSPFAGGPAGLSSDWLWDRGNPKLAYFPEDANVARIYQRDLRLNTSVLLKDFNLDPRYSQFWTAAGHPSTRLVGLNADRVQENFCGRVRSGTLILGAVVWNRNTNALWNYQAPAGKSVDRVQLDDTGLYVAIRFQDGSWQVGRLDSPTGLMTLSAIQSASPQDYDVGSLQGTQRAFTADGSGTKSWTLDPIASVGTQLFSHPQRSGKLNVYNKGKASVQSFDNRVAYATYADCVPTLPWQSTGGSVYKIDWAAEMVAVPDKLVPEVVRQGILRLTKVPFQASTGTPPAAANHYVSPTGASSGPGTITQPWSLTYAFDGAGGQITPGDVIHLRGGIYNLTATTDINVSGTLNSRITFAAYPGEKPILKGRQVRVDGNYLTIDGLTFEGPINQATNQVLIHNCHHIVFIRNEIRFGDYHAGLSVDEAYEISIYYNYIHDNGISTQHDHGIYFKTTQGINNFIVGNLLVRNAARGLSLHDNSGVGVFDVLVAHNTVVGNGSTGILVNDGDRNTLANNIVAFNGFARNQRQIRVLSGNSNVLRNNLTFSDNSSLSGIENTTGSSLVGNVVGDPLFVNRQGGDYHITAGSPARGLALAQYVFTPDFDGGARDASPDVGAYEYGAVPPTTGGGAVLNAGEWSYDTATNTLYVRCIGNVSPSTVRMAVFDWRFGMEEIVLVRANGVLIGRLCRHFSYTADPLGADIDAARGACASYDGSRVVFGSNWGGGTVGIYAVLTDPAQ